MSEENKCLLIKIAVIEDSETDQFVLTHYLNGLPMKLETDFYTSVRQFAEANRDYDLILTDLNVPESWGLETITTLAALTSKPIIVMTNLGAGYLTGRPRKELIDNGAYDVIGKQEMTSDLLENLIKTALGTI